MKITGFIETYLTNKKGVKRKVGEQHNTISPEFYAVLAKYLTSHATTDLIELDDMFIGGAGYTWIQTGRCGIAAMVIGYESLQAAFASVASQPAANQLRVTGTWTNPETGTRTLGLATLGRSWIKTQGWETPGDGGYWNYGNVGFTIATGGMSNTDVPSGELLTIVWTITFTVH